MAEALTRKRSRRKAPDPRARELRRLKLSVCDDVGFRLYLATYDQPKRRDELIARVSSEAEAEKVRVTELDLAEGGSETNLVGLLRAHLASKDLPDGWRQAVMVTGIERRLDYSAGSEGFAFLHQANLLRDVLPEAAPVPVVLWLSRLASGALPAEAPDLWHWRAANFDFTGDEAPRLELLRELATYRQQDEGGSALAVEQRRGRIQMLKELLAELEREGPPQSKRQAGERAAVLMDLGVQVLRSSRAAEALPHIEQALIIMREIGDRRGEGDAHIKLGLAYADLGEVEKAIAYYEQALVIAREIGDRRSESNALGNLGNAYADLGEVEKAVPHYEQALIIAHNMGDRQGEGCALRNLGLAYFRLGKIAKAIGCTKQALVIAREIGDRQGEGYALSSLGRVYAESRRIIRAIGCNEQALVVAREIGDRQGERYALRNLGLAYFLSGEIEKAIAYNEQDLVIAREIGDRRREGYALGSLGRVVARSGEIEKAIALMQQAKAIGEQIGDPRIVQFASQALGRLSPE